MTLLQLDILNYKNIRQASLAFSPRLNCLVGDNGAGKTNVLDAIHFLAFTRSATHAPDACVLTHGEEQMMLAATVNLQEPTDEAAVPEERISCSLQAGGRKVFRRGQKAYKRMSEHIGLLPLILVSPDDTTLLRGPGEGRRRMMDMAISQSQPAYIAWLNQYNRALQQRNALLRDEQHPPTVDLLEPYEMVMAETGEQIFAAREAYFTALEPLFTDFYTRIAESHEQPSLTLESHCRRGPLLEVIQRDRAKDLAVGYSLHGIHRDDLLMQLAGFPAGREGSQGQGKTYVLALRLAQHALLAKNGRQPLLLLDDIFDKLDAHRVQRLVHIVSQPCFGQIFLTDTNRQHIDGIVQAADTDYRLFHVSNGQID